MTAIDMTSSVSARSDVVEQAPPTLPLLNEMPRLLEYRGDADADIDFIPKTIAGFAMGSIAMFLCLTILDAMFLHRDLGVDNLFAWELAFAVGIIGVSSSLLLVGLKVRADHSPVPLYAKHWLNSIGTGALYSVMIWGPWVVMSQFHINKFVAAAVWMTLMVFPAIAAKWVIGPHDEHTGSAAK